MQNPIKFQKGHQFQKLLKVFFANLKSKESGSFFDRISCKVHACKSKRNLWGRLVCYLLGVANLFLALVKSLICSWFFPSIENASQSVVLTVSSSKSHVIIKSDATWKVIFKVHLGCLYILSRKKVFWLCLDFCLYSIQMSSNDQ